MMQPILLSTPSNSQANERLSDTTAIDKQAANDELLQEEKSPGNFFDLFASAIMGTEKKKDGVVEEKGVEVNELAEQLVPALNSDGETVTADKELASTSIEQDSQKVETSEDEELLLENSMPEQPDFVPPPVENAPLLEPVPLVNSAVETGQLNSSEAVKETAQPSIIAQIESAQKMDTQLSAPQKNASLSNASPMLPDSLKKGQEANSAAFDRSNLTSEKTAPKSVDNKLKNNLIKSLKSVSENTVKNTSDGDSLITDDNQSTPEAVTLDSSTKEQDKSQQAVPVTPFDPLLQGESAASLAAEDNKPQQAVQDSSLMAGENRSIQGVQAASVTTVKDKSIQEVQIDSLPRGEGTPLKAVKDESSKAEVPLQKTDTDNDLLFANNREADRNTLTHVVDSNGARLTEVNSSGLSKLVNHNIHTATPTSSSHPQPLDIHAKHASALLGERVLMMINQGKQEVQIRLDPAELGSIYVKLHVHQDQLNLSIQTDVAQSKDIIQHNLPKLREQLAQQGVSLGETSVEQHSQRQQQNPNHQGKNVIQGNSGGFSHDSSRQITNDTMEWIASKIPLSAQGIDYYA